MTAVVHTWEEVYLIIGLVALVPIVWAIVDVARRPVWQFSTGRKVMWALTLGVGWLFVWPLALVSSVVYLSVLRRRFPPAAAGPEGPMGSHHQANRGPFGSFGQPGRTGTGTDPGRGYGPSGQRGPGPYGPQGYPGPHWSTPDPYGYQPPPASLPDAGWYPDPAGSRQERWWDGRGWTGHLR